MAKTCFVTGSSGVTGKNIALEFARAGYDVGVTYTSNEEGAKDAVAQIEAMGQKAKYYYLDTRDVDASVKTIESFAEEFGGIDVFVNNTGLTIYSRFLDTEVDVWMKLFETNLRGMFFCGQAAARDMIKRGTKGVIINLSSVHANGTWPHDSLYGPCKAAIKRMTEAEAVDLAKHGIRVNCVAPGYIETGWENSGEVMMDLYKQTMARIPLGRYVDASEIGKVAVFLASDDASYITGQTLFVDGGALLPVVCENSYVTGMEPPKAE